MNFIGIDLEGVLIPEIWVSLAEKTGINELKLTTKDISDYKELMKIRIDILLNAYKNPISTTIVSRYDELKKIGSTSQTDGMETMRDHLKRIS